MAFESPAAEQAIVDAHARGDADLEEVVVDGCLQIARRHLAAGRIEEAKRLFGMFESSTDERIRCAVLSGLWQADPISTRPRIVQSLESNNAHMRRFATQLVREQTDPEVVKLMARSIPELSDTGRVCLLDAWGGRRDPLARSLAVASLRSSQREVRRAALQALAASGQVEDVSLLLRREKMRTRRSAKLLSEPFAIGPMTVSRPNCSSWRERLQKHPIGSGRCAGTPASWPGPAENNLNRRATACARRCSWHSVQSTRS